MFISTNGNKKNQTQSIVFKVFCSSFYKLLSASWKHLSPLRAMNRRWEMSFPERCSAVGRITFFILKPQQSGKSPPTWLVSVPLAAWLTSNRRLIPCQPWLLLNSSGEKIDGNGPGCLQACKTLGGSGATNPYYICLSLAMIYCSKQAGTIAACLSEAGG